MMTDAEKLNGVMSHFIEVLGGNVQRALHERDDARRWARKMKARAEAAEAEAARLRAENDALKKLFRGYLQYNSECIQCGGRAVYIQEQREWGEIAHQRDCIYIRLGVINAAPEVEQTSDANNAHS